MQPNKNFKFRLYALVYTILFVVYNVFLNLSQGLFYEFVSRFIGVFLAIFHIASIWFSNYFIIKYKNNQEQEYSIFKSPWTKMFIIFFIILILSAYSSFYHFSQK
jgi:hypothetical protein